VIDGKKWAVLLKVLLLLTWVSQFFVATQQLDAIDSPLAMVFEVKASDRVRATQKGSPYASGDAVVIRCVFNGDLAISGFWHVSSLDKWSVGYYGKSC